MSSYYSAFESLPAWVVSISILLWLLISSIVLIVFFVRIHKALFPGEFEAALRKQRKGDREKLRENEDIYYHTKYLPHTVEAVAVLQEELVELKAGRKVVNLIQEVENKIYVLSQRLVKIEQYKINNATFIENASIYGRNEDSRSVFVGIVMSLICFVMIVMHIRTLNPIFVQYTDEADGKISIKNVELNNQKISDQIVLLKSYSDELENFDNLPFSETRKIIEKVPLELTKLQALIEVQEKNNSEVRVKLDQQKSEADKLRLRVDTLNNLSKSELLSIKTTIFEETEKSSQKYFIFGLLFSIPIFWFSEVLKGLGVRFFRKSKLIRRLFGLEEPIRKIDISI